MVRRTRNPVNREINPKIRESMESALSRAQNPVTGEVSEEAEEREAQAAFALFLQNHMGLIYRWFDKAFRAHWADTTGRMFSNNFQAIRESIKAAELKVEMYRLSPADLVVLCKDIRLTHGERWVAIPSTDGLTMPKKQFRRCSGPEWKRAVDYRYALAEIDVDAAETMSLFSTAAGIVAPNTPNAPFEHIF